MNKSREDAKKQIKSGIIFFFIGIAILGISLAVLNYILDYDYIMNNVIKPNMPAQ